MYATMPGTSCARHCHRLTGRDGLQVVVVLPCNYAAHQETIRAAPSWIGVFDASGISGRWATWW